MSEAFSSLDARLFFCVLCISFAATLIPSLLIVSVRGSVFPFVSVRGLPFAFFVPFCSLPSVALAKEGLFPLEYRLLAIRSGPYPDLVQVC
jgi:hypothetical protein